MTNLLIVESKSKCSKIESYLGNGYKCMASLGHIYELKKGLEAIDINNNFEPKYQLIPGKKSVVGDLQRAATRAELVYLAADPDREGEAIALHLSEALNLPSHKVKRITFNEITKNAVTEAIKNPRNIDMPLCNAQKARRVLDRLFGFTISPVLWDYVAKSLSAGRCQSPALDIICKRELEIRDFSSNLFYSLFGNLISSLGNLSVKYEDKITSKEQCYSLMKLILVSSFIVDNIVKKERMSRPPPPHTTSTLQQEASNKFNMNPKTTMQIAQKLYEKAHITYMRTDSTVLSEDAKKNIATYVKNKYGDDYYIMRNYENKKKNTQEAHECIRPVSVINSPDKMKFSDSGEAKLYEIIWKRAVASQMSERRYTQQIMTILAKSLIEDVENIVKLFSDEEVTTFQGYDILYNHPLGGITNLKQGDNLDLDNFTGEERDTKPKPRYTEASLVKELERSGIGRPSTFSNIVSTLLERNYVEFGSISKRQVERTTLFVKNGDTDINSKTSKKSATSEKGKLKATDLGLRVRDFLNQHFSNILSEELTSNIEDRLDIVAEGNDCWISVVRDFYNSFYPTVQTMTQASSGLNKVVKTIGMCNKYKYSIINTKYGLAISRTSNTDKISKVKYLPISKELYESGDNLTLEQIKCLYRFPRTIKYSCGTEVEFCYGKNGFYLKYPGSSTSLDGDFSNGKAPSEIEMGTFLEMIQENKNNNDDNDESNNNSKRGIIKKLGNYNICNGPYGPFVAKTKGSGKPVSIPKEIVPENITEEECKALFTKRYNTK